MELDRPHLASRARPDVLVVVVLAVACLAIGTFLAPSDSGDFWFFRDRAHDWFGASGWHLHVDHPNTQSGPLALLLVAAVAAVDRTGITLVPLVSALLCGIALASLLRLPEVRRAPDSRVLLCGVALTAWWWYLARFGHLDDALVLTLAVVATALVRRDRRIAAAVLVGLAIAAKPWAVFLVPITLQRGKRWHDDLRTPAISVAVAGVWWAPFVALAPGTLGAVQPTVAVAPDSILQLLGVEPWSTAPAGLRTVQLLVATVLVAWCARRGRPELGLLAGVAVRLLLDPATWEYYTVGLVAGAVLADLVAGQRRGRVPWLTVAAATLVVPGDWPSPDLRAGLRTMACLGLLLFVVRSARTGSAATFDDPRPTAAADHDRCPSADADARSDSRPGHAEFV